LLASIKSGVKQAMALISIGNHMRWIFIIILSILKIGHRVDLPHFHDGLVTVPASEKYSSPSVFEKILFGTNYRKEWETPVTMPVFNIKQSNYSIVRMGGGQQTTSLELADDKGMEWTLRSVDKDVRAPRKFMEDTFIEWIIQDHVSAAYPYAGLSIPDISNAAGVPAGEQHLYFVRDDTAFGEYRSAMANRVFILVNHQKQPQKGLTTDEMLVKLKSDTPHYVDQKEYLRARLVDWLVADWDRHQDQWRWVQRNTDSGIAFYVVPRDRDQAFFKSNGWLIRFIGLFFMPHITKFNKTGRGIKGLSKKTRALDKQFTNQLKKEDWESIIKEFQKNMTDSLIESAIKKQPPEIFAIRGEELVSKIRSRRDGLLKHVMKYYYFLKD
jgi:hypothetical protein